MNNDKIFVAALDSVKDDNDQVIKIKRHLVEKETLESLGEEYEQTKEAIRQTIVNYTKKILNNLHDLRQSVLEKVKQRKILYLADLEFESSELALFFAELVCYKNKNLSLDREFLYLYSLNEYSSINILALIKSNILENGYDLFSQGELLEFLTKIFPDILDIDSFISLLLSHRYVNMVDDKYYFPYIYQTKKEMINFIFSIKSEPIKIPKGNAKLKEELDLYFPDVFTVEDEKRVITTTVENSHNIVLWGSGLQIHKKHIENILQEFDFAPILGHINSILHENRIDLETTYNKYEQSLQKANIINKYALHTLLKIKYPNTFKYPKAPWIAKPEIADANLTETLLALMNEDRVYHVDELTGLLHQTKLRVLQLIERIECIQTVEINQFINTKLQKVSSKLSQKDSTDTKNILVLYNPYYNKNTIKDHIDILLEDGKVAFGKILSAHRDPNHPNQKRLDNIYDSVSKENPLRLFLTDYDSFYVANVIDVEYETDVKKPSYYENMEVESWFIFDDIRVIVDKNFTEIRDRILPNFKTVGDYSSTYTIYGNSYVYPLELVMKEPIEYFYKEDQNHKYYIDIYKSDKQLQMKKSLINYNFGEKRFYNFATSTQDNLIDAELEYEEHKQDDGYDFSSVVIKYTKAVEYELWAFLKEIVKVLNGACEDIKDVTYTLNGREYPVTNLLENKASFGTYLYLIKKHQPFINMINQYIDPKGGMIAFIFKSIPCYISVVQEIRNESAHGESKISQEQCEELRENVMGIGRAGMLAEFIRMRKYV